VRALLPFPYTTLFRSLRRQEQLLRDLLAVEAAREQARDLALARRQPAARARRQPRPVQRQVPAGADRVAEAHRLDVDRAPAGHRSEEHTSELQSQSNL